MKKQYYCRDCNKKITEPHNIRDICHKCENFRRMARNDELIEHDKKMKEKFGDLKWILREE